jgi:hypothetical protein
MDRHDSVRKIVAPVDVKHTMKGHDTQETIVYRLDPCQRSRFTCLYSATETGNTTNAGRNRVHVKWTCVDVERDNITYGCVILGRRSGTAAAAAALGKTHWNILTRGEKWDRRLFLNTSAAHGLADPWSSWRGRADETVAIGMNGNLRYCSCDPQKGQLDVHFSTNRAAIKTR